MSKSIRKNARGKAEKTEKPAKPRDDFPLFPHARGHWAKKVKGKLHYFGKIADDFDGEKALQLWLDQKDDGCNPLSAPSVDYAACL